MKYKYMILGIIIFFSMGTLFVINIVRDNKNTTEKIALIKEEYDKFKEYTTEYNEIRKSLSSGLSSLTLKDLESSYDEYKESFDKYNNIIKNIDSSIQIIDTNCSDIRNNKSVSKICSSYQVTYEKIINIYINDVSNFNYKVTSLNKEEYKQIDLIHDKYIDYNNDSVFEGRSNEEEKEN